MEEKYEVIDAYEKTQIIYLKKIKEFKERKKKEMPKSIIWGFFLLPFLIVSLIIASNSNELIKPRLAVFLLLMMLGILSFNIYRLVKILRKRNDYNFSKSNLKLAAFMMSLALVFSISTGTLIYKNKAFREWLITKAMNTNEHQYLATWFYDKDLINNTISKLVKTSSNYETSDAIVFNDIIYNPKKFANKIEEEIFKKENEDDIYKIIEVTGVVNGSNKTYQGWLTIVYDPADVKLAISEGAGVNGNNYGQILSVMHQKSGALVSMNAGGFYDPEWRSNGGIPHGLVIKDGKVLSSFRRGIESGGLVGFTNENKLILGRFSEEEAIEKGIRDAVDWGPYLIHNSKDLFPNKNTYSWAVARTAIGQRADGIVLMLVIDGMQAHSHGASYSDMSSIMAKYGAVNASCMDGGTSTSMYTEGRFLNVPFNGKQRTIRSLPNAWIVRKD